MGLSSLHLDAFFAAAQTLNFSQAAKELSLTQSALSQRIKSLESDLSLTLFVRMPRGVNLTDAGSRLLRYCQARNSLERELLEELKGTATEGLGGVLRIGGYSSIVRSVLLPTLAPLLRENPNICVHLQSAEMRELPEFLLTGLVDLIVTDGEIHRTDLESHILGEEEYVMVNSVEYPIEHDTYLDHDPKDPITAQFLTSQDKPITSFRRSFLDEIYSICDGVALGFGRAVVSRHLVEDDPRLLIDPSFVPLRVPVYLHYLKQPFYTDLQKHVVAAILEGCPKRLTTGS